MDKNTKIINYKVNLNIPKTNFPMKANLKNKQIEILKYWDQIDIYQKIKNIKDQNKNRSVLHFGPPYCNGDLHLGHGINLLLKDIFLRIKKVNGHSIQNITGHDCHGLPIEMKACKAFTNQNLSDLHFLDLITKCLEVCNKYIQQHQNSFRKFGFLMDTKVYYSTKDWLDKIYHCFTQLVLENKVYVDRKPMSWCIKTQCVVCDSDIEYKNKNTTSIFVSFQVVDRENLYLLIWTTTYWTVMDNTAIAINKKITYCIVEYKNKFLVVAKNTIPKLENYLVTKLNIQKTISIEELCHLQYYHPLNQNRKYNVILANNVEDDFGTGLVHLSPAHGGVDYELYQKYSADNLSSPEVLDYLNYTKNKIPITIDIIDSINKNGYYIDSINNNNIFNDVYITQENKILSKLKDCVIFQHSYNHTYPFFARSGEPVYQLSSEQLFISLEETKLQLDKQLDRVKFFPDNVRDQLKNMILDRKEWCISRNRVYGVPIGVFIGKHTRKILINKELQRDLNQAMSTNYKQFFQEEEVKQILSKHVNADSYELYHGVLDVWFDSACVSTLLKTLYEEELQDQVYYIEGKDQSRGWFQSSFLTAMLLKGQAPYDAIITHGFVLDEIGKKMSKSKQNTLSLDDYVEEYGKDILHLWLAKSNYYSDVVFSHVVLNDAAKQYRRIRNVMRYLISVVESNPIDDYQINSINDFEGDLEKYAFYHTLKVAKECATHIDENNIQKTFLLLRDFIEMISSDYFNWRKDAVYFDHCNNFPLTKTNKLYPIIKLYMFILRLLNILLFPFVPITAEEIFLYCKNLNLSVNYFNKDSIGEYTINSIINQHIVDVNNTKNSTKNIVDAVNNLNKSLIDIQDKINNLKNNNQLSSNKDVEIIIPHTNKLQTIMDIVNCSNIKLSDNNDTYDINIITHLPQCLRCDKRIIVDKNDPQQKPILCIRCKKIYQEYNIAIEE